MGTITIQLMNTASMQISTKKISPPDIGTTTDVLHQVLNLSANKMTNRATLFLIKIMMFHT
jgi:hypothetical protein